MSGRLRSHAVRSTLRRAGNSLSSAWPVFLVFLSQRLLTVAFLAREPGGLEKLALRWDAGWYLRLAEGGYVYPRLGADGSIRASNLAYFPLFPWLVRRVAHAGLLAPEQALIAVSWLGGLLAVWAIFALGEVLYGRRAGIALAALWGMAPASLTLTMGYPEGLFAAAAAAALRCLVRRCPVWAGACAAVAGLLRPSVLAVIAAVGAYFVVELGRWLVDVVEPFPKRALAGAVLSTVGLAAFMVYVGVRTGEPFGYFAVQRQWGQHSAHFSAYWRSVEQGLFGSVEGSSVPTTIAVSGAYLVMFCLIVFDRRLLWPSVYAAGLLVLSLAHVTFQHVYARQLLVAFVLLIPLIRLRVSTPAAVAAITAGSLLMSWGSAQFLLAPGTGL